MQRCQAMGSRFVHCRRQHYQVAWALANFDNVSSPPKASRSVRLRGAAVWQYFSTAQTVRCPQRIPETFPSTCARSRAPPGAQKSARHVFLKVLSFSISPFAAMRARRRSPYASEYVPVQPFRPVKLRKLGAGVVSGLQLLSRQRRFGFSQIPDSLHQVCRLNRFREKLEIVSPRPGTFKQIGSGGFSGKQQHFAVRTMLSHLNREIDPGEQWHHDIDDKKVGSVETSGFQSLKRISEGSGMEASVQLQNHCQA